MCDSPDAISYRFGPAGLEPIEHPDLCDLDRLIGVERSIARLRANGRAFVDGRPALDMLLYGERGTGKSSALRGLLRELAPRGLRLVEVTADDLLHLPRVYAALRGRPERFVLCCDDLSFAADDASWRHLKAALDGGLEARPENVVIAVTSNRRHLLAKHIADNREATWGESGEVHPGETTEEKISLSDRFGLSLPFFSFDQETYLRIVDLHATSIGLTGRIERSELHARAVRFALERGGRSGRMARHACIAILQEVEEKLT